jgi:hypothetical protein
MPALSRRRFLSDFGLGFYGLAAGSLLWRDGLGRARAAETQDMVAKAKSVIWLFMQGGVSHMESFDPKPELNKYAGLSIEETPYKDVLHNPLNRRNVREFTPNREIFKKIMPLQVGYRPRGQSGTLVSDWWPNVGEMVDDLAILRSMWVTDNDHAAEYEANTGHHIFDGSHPSLGSWVKYGLSSLSDNLPEFVALGEPPGSCCGGTGSHSGSYLGPQYDAVQLSVDPSSPMLPPGFSATESRASRDAKFELAKALNQIAQQTDPKDVALQAKMQSYELAFRMQHSLPGLLDFSSERPETLKLYGFDQDQTRPFAEKCLTARRLVENGVRFVQLYHGGGGKILWDAHEKLRETHSSMCAQVDQPIAGLLQDLKRTGLLDTTLVVFMTEFGRTPGAQNVDGRDHNPYGFSIWMAGGGVKRGIVHGATDELGMHAVENRHYITDVHATVLKLLGLRASDLEIPGRRRLKMEIGEPIDDVIA